jgi:arabinofuranan 3-O-arabinosyltransferase
MESGDRSPETLNASNSGKTGIRLTASSVFLIALAFVQSPGMLVADTKFDLAVNPAKFLGSALHLWDPSTSFGQVQNQAYGYLWPMGPFFWIGHELGVPGWVVQRSWLALVMVVAFLGVSLVARELGLRSDGALILTGLSYALSPRMLTDLGAISIEVWPMALLPWVLLPLVRGSKRGSPRQAAAWSALAVGMIGGVNAAAASAVLPMGVIWLLTRTKGPRRRSMLLWWPIFTLMATLWWLVPLFLLGRFSPPFLDYIETARVTTLSTPLFDALRGTSTWVPYIDSMARAGNDLVTTFYAPLNSGVILLFGVFALLMPRLPERRFLVASLLTGLVLVSSSHLGAVQGWFAGDLNHLLDGALSAVRNVHKFDPIVRLPMVLALGWLFDEALATARRNLTRQKAATGWQRVLSSGSEFAIPALIVLVALGAAAPALLMRITPTGDVVEIPPYWSQAANWLEEQSPPGTTLLAPGTSFATYLWGSPRDEPLQFVSETPWAVRNSIPLVPPGNIRMLNAIQERFDQGRGSEGLADYLRRAGIRFILVRNDLQKTSGLVDPVLTHQALEQSPGIDRVKTFGPAVGGFPTLDKGDHRVLINQGWQSLYPALEVFEVANSGGQFAQSQQTPVVIGGPENLLGLADNGLLQDQPTVLGFDADSAIEPDGPVLLTDGMQARVREIGSLNEAYSSVLTLADLDRFLDPRDYLPEGSEKWRTWAQYQGIMSLTASSSASDSGKNLGHGASEAMDGDLNTSWESRGLQLDPWLRVGLLEPQAISRITITTPMHSPDPQLMRVETQNESTKLLKIRAGVPQEVSLSGEDTSWIKILGESNNGSSLSIAEIDIPGVTVTKFLRTPEVPEKWGAPDAMLFEGSVNRFAKCVNFDAATRCADRGVSSGEEDGGLAREVRIPAAADYQVSAVGQVLPGSALDDLIQSGRFVNVMADSVMTDDPRGSPVAAIDADPSTTWIASPYDQHPTFVVSWLQPRKIRGVQLSLQDGAAARLPTSIELTWSKGSRKVDLTDGAATFPAIRTNQLSMRLSSTDRSFDLGFDLQQNGLGIGIGELHLNGLPGLSSPLPDQPLPSTCGAGPSIQVGEDQLQTALLASPADLFANKPVALKVCDAAAAQIPAGSTMISTSSTPEVAISTLSLVQANYSMPTATEVTGRMTRSGQGLEAEPVETGGLLVHRSNTNPGWTAEQGSSHLKPVVVDGWQQAWKLRSAERVTAKFWPDRIYRAGMAAGAATFVILILILVVQQRRKPGLELLPLVAAPSKRWLEAGLAAVAFGLLAGWWGILAAALGAGCHLLLNRGKSVGLAPWLLSLPVLLAAVGYSVMPWGSSEGWLGELAWPHYLVMVSLGAIAGSLVTKEVIQTETLVDS